MFKNLIEGYFHLKESTNFLNPIIALYCQGEGGSQGSLILPDITLLLIIIKSL